MAIRLGFLAVSLIVANFIWQVMTGHNWGKAVEISYFQVVALLVAYASLRYWPVQPS